MIAHLSAPVGTKTVITALLLYLLVLVLYLAPSFSGAADSDRNAGGGLEGTWELISVESEGVT